MTNWMTLRLMKTTTAICQELELRDGEQRRKHRRDQRTEERDVVQREGDRTPGRRKSSPATSANRHTTRPVSTLAKLRTTMKRRSLPPISRLARRILSPCG